MIQKLKTVFVLFLGLGVAGCGEEAIRAQNAQQTAQAYQDDPRFSQLVSMSAPEIWAVISVGGMVEKECPQYEVSVDVYDAIEASRFTNLNTVIFRPNLARELAEEARSAFRQKHTNICDGARREIAEGQTLLSILLKNSE